MQEAKNLKEIQTRVYPPTVEGDHTFGSVSDKIGDGKADIALGRDTLPATFCVLHGKAETTCRSGWLKMI